MKAARREVRAASYWGAVNLENLRQLRADGFENFKRTIAKNYFTWSGADDQIPWLKAHLPFSDVLNSYFTGGMNGISNRGHYRLFILTALLYHYCLRKSQKVADIVHQLREPAIGNPLLLNTTDGHYTTQDLLNSILEHDAVMHSGEPIMGRTILELGAGYGRTAYVFLSLHRHIRYIIVDVPPALLVAQKYLSSVFPDRRIFNFRRFRNFAQVSDELSNAEIVFLTPSQLQHLKPGSVSLSLTISSLQEMPPYQVAYYFSEFNRLTSGHFYMKQYQHGVVKFGGHTTDWDSYPIPPHWKPIFSEPCEVQANFNHALYRTSRD